MAYYAHQGLANTSPDLAALEIPPDKPEELVLFETLVALNIPFQSGGYIDQPWIIMQAIETAGGSKAQYLG